MRLKLYRGRWYAVWTEAGRTRRAALRTADRSLAEQRLADLTACPAPEDIAGIYQAYLQDLKARHKDASRAEYAWLPLQATFGGLRPDQVTRERCRLYAAQRRLQGRADGTIGKELDCLRAALRWHDPATAAKVEAPRRPPPRERHLSRAEHRRLRLAAKRVAPHIWLFIVLAVATGARKQAILDLTWDRVDFERGEIRLGTKPGGKGRAIVPMNRHARRALLLAKKAAQSRWVIEYAGGSVGSIRRGFTSACKAAGLPDVTPHVLRHTAAVWMAEKGISMDEIGQYLGHSDPRITYRVYARFSPSYLKRAAQALE